MRVYEEYESSSEKRKAQDASRPLSRMKPTGKSRGYTLVFHEDGCAGTPGTLNACGNILNTEPGDGPHSLSHCTPSRGYLSDNCRVVGMDYIPAEWRKAFALYLWRGIRDDFHADYNKRYHRFLRSANREFKLDLDLSRFQSTAHKG